MKKQSITVKLTLVFILFSGVLVLALSIPAYLKGQDSLRAATLSELVSTALEKQSALDNWALERKHGVEDIASQKPLRAAVKIIQSTPKDSTESTQASQTILENLEVWSGQGHHFQVFEVLDGKTGRVLVSTDPAQNGKFREAQTYFTNGKLAPYIESPFYDLSLKQPVMVASAPLMSTDGGELIAVLAGTLNMDEMNQIVHRRTGLKQTDDSFLVNTSNLFVTQPHLVSNPSVLQRGIHTEAVNLCLAKQSGSLTANDYLGMPSLIVYRWLPDQQVCLITKVSQDEAFAPARALGSSMALIGGVVLLLGAIAAFSISRAIVRPVLELVHGAEQIGQGNLKYRIAVKSQDEIGRLGSEFNIMAQAISESQARLSDWADQLELRVKERTGELRVSEERYRILAETSPDMIFMVDQKDRVQYVNLFAARQFGKTPEQVTGKLRSELFPPAIAEGQKNSLARVFQTGEPVSSEASIAFPGSKMWLDTQLVPIRDESGTVSAVMGISRDITERKNDEQRIQEEKTFSESIINSLPGIFYLLDTQGKFLRWNKNFERVSGYSAEEMPERNSLDFFIGEDRELVEERIRETFTAGESQVETCFTSRNGQGTPYLLTGLRVKMDGQVYLIGTGIDISEKKSAEEKLQASEAELRALFTALQDVIFVIDSQGRYLKIAPTGVNLLNKPPADLEGQLMRDVLPKETADLFLEIVNEALQSGQPVSMEYSLPVGEQIVWFAGIASPMTENTVVWAARDITERKHAEDAIHESEERFRAIFEHSTVAKSLTSPEGKLLQVNQAFADLLGYSIEEMQQLNFAQATHPKDIAESRECIRCLLANEKTRYRMEKRYFHRSGKIVWTDVSTSLLRDNHGIPLYFIIGILDITNRKQAEEDLKKANDELARSNSELERFAYVASHDLQEPLRMVTSYVQLLERRYKDKLDGDAHEFIGYAVDGSNRMKVLINDLLAYSRVGTRGKEFVLTDCEAVLEHSLDNLKVTIVENQAEITHDQLPRVVADEVQLEQLFQNLIANALKFRGPETPQIHIGLARKEDNWIFSVKDNGIGIDPQYFDRIFIIFQRLHTRKKYEGTGIGLAVSKRIVERHGGRIWVESQPGTGSTFYFSMPVTGEKSRE